MQVVLLLAAVCGATCKQVVLLLALVCGATCKQVVLLLALVCGTTCMQVVLLLALVCGTTYMQVVLKKVNPIDLSLYLHCQYMNASCFVTKVNPLSYTWDETNNVRKIKW